MKILKSFLFLLIPIASFAASGNIVVNQFSGLDTQDNPSALQPNQSQDLLNVRLQPGGKSVFKRDGYGLFETLNNVSTGSVHGGYHFQQTGGANVQLWGSDTGLYSIVNDAQAVLIATGTVGSTWQCTDNLGFAYCVTNSGADALVKTDGSAGNTSYHPEVPAGTIITSTPLQLVISGVSPNLSTIYVSANNNFLNFTAGPLPTDPYTEIINAPGSRMTHMAYYFGKLFWWKDQSFGYVAGSSSQGTVSITIASNQIGTLDNSSAFWNPTTYETANQFSTGAGPTSTGNPYFNELASLGGIFFRGQDSHVYQYDGYSLTRLSRIITPNVTSSSPRKFNSWTQTDASDFGTGYFVGTSSLSSPGDLTLQSVYDGFSSLSNWAQTGTYPYVIGPGYVSMSSTSTSTQTSLMYSVNTSSITNSWRMKSYFQYTSTGTGTNAQFYLFVSTGPGSFSTANHSQGYGLSVFGSGSNITLSIVGPLSTDSSTTENFTMDTNIHSVELVRSSTGYMQAYFDEVAAPFITKTDNTLQNFTNVMLETFSFNPSTKNIKISNLSFTCSSGTYYSSVHNAPNINKWSSFVVDYQNNGGSNSFFLRSSTNSFSITSSTPTWISQTNGSLITIPVGQFFQFRDDLSVTATTQTPSVSDFTLNWFEGNASDKAYIGYFQDAIWFSVSSGSSTSSNNTIFYLDLLNNTWLKDNIPSNGFAVENNFLYFGDPLSQKIYRYGGLTTDNSNPIQSYWKSMDFTGADPTVQNEYIQADFSFAAASTTISYTYDIDQSTSMLTTIPLSLYSAKNSIIKRGLLLAVGKIGTYYNFLVGDNSSQPKWTLMAHRAKYNPLNWVVQTSQ